MTRHLVDGLLLLNKPQGISSNLALQKVKGLFKAKKAGHTGTLDPLATGLLPICFGETTKFSAFLLDADKEYVATIKLGVTTDTYDAAGKTITTCEVGNITKDDIMQVQSSYVGEITQTPPVYSALKVNGKALYEYARNGEEVEVRPRKVTIHEIEFLEFIEEHIFKIRVKCSKGTYIRSLSHDLGQQLGVGATLVGLTRTRTNDFVLDPKITLDYLGGLSYEDRCALLLPVDVLVSNLPKIEINDSQYDRVSHGNYFAMDMLVGCAKIRIYHNERFLGVACVEGGLVKPARLIATR